MQNCLITQDTFDFLNDLRENNNRPWFSANKDRFVMANQEMKDFLSSLTAAMNEMDSIEANKLFRIYRDVRFSKDKTPYNFHFSMSMSRTKPRLRGGYYVKITPGDSALACGFWNPNPHDLKLIRKNIDLDSNRMREVLESEKIKSIFGAIEGDQVKTAPKGFPKDHVAIDLLRFKQLILSRGFSDKEVCSDQFISTIVESFQAVRPWFDYMSEILTHNLDGEPLYV